MEEVQGTKETKEVLKLLIELGEAVDKAMVDKKFDAAELGLLIAPLLHVAAAFEGVGKVPAELKDLSEAEQLELVEFVKTELELEADKVELVVEKGLELAVKVAGFVKLFAKVEAPTA